MRLSSMSNRKRYRDHHIPRDEDNHPGGTAGDPNWFYYWGQVYVNANVRYNASLAAGGQVPGMVDWSYTTEPDKTRIEIGTEHPGSYRSYGVGELLSGIDRYIGSVIHEEMHVDQISRADQLVPVAAGTSFQYGWSWNQGLSHNHWDQGGDNAWGDVGVDDDGNSVMDDAATSPPFEPGQGTTPNGRDNDLSHSGDSTRNWPAAWALPSPDNGPQPVESEAINWSDQNIAEDQYAAQDWGAPGKRHRTGAWND